MNIEIRTTSKSDIETILDFMVDYYKIENIKYNREKSKDTLINFIANNKLGTLWIIKMSDKEIGYLCLTFSYTLQCYGKDCFLDEIYIKPEFRNQGIGTEVLRFIENYLINNNFKAMHLIVYDHNKNAYKYYIKNGFHAHNARFMTKEFNIY